MNRDGEYEGLKLIKRSGNIWGRSPGLAELVKRAALLGEVDKVYKPTNSTMQS